MALIPRSNGGEGTGKPSGPTGRAAPRGGRAKRKPEQAFDQWLSRGLHQMFDQVAKEPIPEDLLRLIEDDETKRSG